MHYVEAVMHTRWVICLVAVIGLSAGAGAQDPLPRDGDKDVLSLQAKTGKGWIGAALVEFHFRASGELVITGRMTGEGVWTQTGATVVMETARSIFKGTITGNRVSGQRTLKADKNSADEWSAQLRETSSIEEESMAVIWFIIAVAVPLVLLALIGVAASVLHRRIAANEQVKKAQIAADAQVKEAQLGAELKRDMLARGLSIEEIERLLTPKPPAVSCHGEGAKTRSEVASTLAKAIAQMAARTGELDEDAVAGLLATLLTKDAPWEVERLPTPNQPAVSGRHDEVKGLASAIAKMPNADGELDEDTVAALLNVFLEKDAARAEQLGTANPARQMAQETQPDAGPGEKGGPESRGIIAGPLVAPDRPRE
jgi:hypothetical protein